MHTLRSEMQFLYSKRGELKFTGIYNKIKLHEIEFLKCMWRKKSLLDYLKYI